MFLQPRDHYILEIIQRHGPLPSHYLFEFTRHIAYDYAGFQKRLLALVRNGYLERPQTLNNPLIHTDFKCYVLTEKAEAALGPKKYQYTTPVGGGYQHAFMSSCITANIELQAKRAGFIFISQEEILAKAPEATRMAKKPLALSTAIAYAFTKGTNSYIRNSNRPTEPDQLFGINYESGYRFFALEADRGTEPLTRGNLNENSILRKILAYKFILITGEYKKRFGIPNLFPLFVTTSDARVSNMIELAREIYPNGAHHLLFKAIPGFHAYFRTPPLLPQLFGKYRRTGEDFDISRP